MSKKKPKAAPAKVTRTRRKVTKEDKILRTSHVHRSRAHDSSAGRRKQGRRDSK